MKAIAKGHGKLLLLACAALCSLAAAATAQADDLAPAETPVCINGIPQMHESDSVMTFLLGGVDVFAPVKPAACADAEPGEGAKLHNHSPLCYSKLSDDVAYFDGGDLAELLSRGYSVPSAVKRDDSWHFVCIPDVGMKRTSTKLGSDKATIVSDAFAGGNDGWWEILEPKA